MARALDLVVNTESLIINARQSKVSTTDFFFVWQ